MSNERWWRRLGVGLGLLTVATVGWAFRVDAVDVHGTTVRITAHPTGPLAVDPTGPFVAVDGLRAGNTAGGRLAVRNQTGADLLVVARAEGGSENLYVRVRAAGAVVAEGPLARLRDGSRPWTVVSGATTELLVYVLLEGGDAPSEVIDVSLQFDVRPTGA